MATTTNGDANSQSILDTVLADVNAIIPNFSALVNSYRLMVGSAEEIHRIPGASPDVLARGIERFDRTGMLIDILIDLLCCKIAFSSNFLAVTSGPVDIFRLLANRLDVADAPHMVAEEILLLEVLRRAQDLAKSGQPSAPQCTPPGPPAYTFATSYFQPPIPPPPPIPPEPPPIPPAADEEPTSKTEASPPSTATEDDDSSGNSPLKKHHHPRRLKK